jgi:methylamine dehydrogenase accessory protein MauD
MQMPVTLLWVSNIALWITMIVLYIAVFLLYRHFGEEIRERQSRMDEGGPQKDELARLELATLDSTLYKLGAENGRPHLVLFGAPNCHACEIVRPLVEDIAKEHAVEVVVIYRGDVETTRKYTEHKPSSVIAVADVTYELNRKWNIRGTPYAVAINKAGRIVQKGTVASKKALDSFVFAAQAANSATQASGKTI